jgi:hypothetical protein
MKICSKCKVEKELTEFGKHKRTKDGLRCACKKCEALATKAYRLTDKGKATTQAYVDKRDPKALKQAQDRYNKTPKRKISMDRYSQSDKGIATRKAYADSPNGKSIRDKAVKDFSKTEKAKIIRNRHKQTDRYKETTDAYNKSPKRRESALAYWRRRRKLAGSKLNDAIHTGIYKGLKKKKNGHKWESLVGYTLEELMKHLENQFKPGMSWENYGEWHVDHIIPKVAHHFNCSTDKAFLLCWSLNNLQPMWAVDNLSKRDKIINPAQISMF